MSELTEHQKANQAFWDDLVDIHAAQDGDGEGYRVRKFLDGECILDPLIRSEIGDIEGKSLLHLQCHFGLDSLSLARLGATITGVDFSPNGIAAARKLSDDSGVPGRFIEGLIEDVPSLIDEQFDMVFTSWGAIIWLADLGAWTAAIDHALKPGGVFYIADAHPLLLAFDDEAEPGGGADPSHGAGAVGGQAVPGYDEELGKPSDTETFVAIKAHVDNWRWKGVPFYLRTGKRLPERVTEIVVQFRCIPHSIFAGRGAKTLPNRLVIGIQPEENIQFSLMAKVPGLDREGLRLRQVPLDVTMPHALSDKVRRIAYERLLLDLIEGDQTLFVRRDEAEARWEWIDAIRASWEEGGEQPKTYTSGSWGPSAAIALTERDGVSWHDE